jgi:hypothetical protein
MPATDLEILTSLKELSAPTILLMIAYYGYNKIEKLEKKNEELNEKVLKVQESCMNVVYELKKVIEDNTSVLRDFIKK